MTTADESTATWLSGFVAQESRGDNVEAWVDRVATAVLTESPELARDADLAGLVRVTVREQWQAFLAGLTEPEAESALAPSAADLAVELARRHHELPVLLAAYRIAQREAWSYAIGVTQGAPDDIDRAMVLVDIWSRAGHWLDHATSASILVHQDERRRVQRSGTAQRYEVVSALLAGTEPDPRDLVLALGGYPLHGTHIAVALRATCAEAIARLEPTALALAARAPGRPLLVEPGGRELWLWIATGTIDLSADLSGQGAAAGVLVAVGGAAEGAGGFRSSHEEALTALRLALAQPRPAAVTRYEDIAALAFLAHDPVAAHRFVGRTLAGLGDDLPGRARLRETVRVLLASAGVDDAAQRLGVHKNTVRYRLAQAEEVLGRSIDDRRGDLDLALRYLDAFPDPPQT